MHAPPEQPRMPPQEQPHMPPEQPCTHPREQPDMPPQEQPDMPPRSNHACPPEQPCMPPTPRSNHACPPGATDGVFYSYLRRFTEHRSLLVVYVLTSDQTLRVVPHGTKGTGPRFVTRPVYLRSQSKNNTNSVLF